MSPLVPVTVLCGLDEELRERVARALYADADVPCVLVEHDLSNLADGYVLRTTHDVDGTPSTARIGIEHPCGSCAVRHSLLPHLLTLAQRDVRHAIVSLPAPIEPQSVVESVGELGVDGVGAWTVLRVDAVAVVVQSARLAEDLDAGDILADVGLACGEDDRRSVAEVRGRQVEYADIIITDGDDGPGDALLRHLNPHARRFDVVDLDLRRLFDLRTHDSDRAADWVEPGSVSALLDAEVGPVRTLVWTSRRPFHPQRLFDALEVLIEPVARGRGSVWLGSQPAVRYCWDSAGGHLALGSLGPWLVDLPPDRWGQVGPAHRARAALEWHEEHGDRGSVLALTGVGLDPRDLGRSLDECLLDDAEWAAASTDPTYLTDPFAAYLRDVDLEETST